MKASLILCVKNGGERLQTCLDHIARMNAPPESFEILLVDNGSTDGISFERMTAFAATSKASCRVLQCFVPGNGAGRNCAIEQASGEVLLFIDGDCYVEPDFVDDWLAVFAARDIGFASGRIMRFDDQHSMLGCNESREEAIVPGGSFVGRGLIQGSNMAFRRACFDRIGLFDERFGSGRAFTGEEWDVALRSCFAGFGGGYIPAPGVAHDHQRTDDTARERLLFYDYSAGAVYAKHAFGRRSLRVLRGFLGDMRHLKFRLNDGERLKRMLKGFVDYYAKRPEIK